jgi:hypothetical protein
MGLERGLGLAGVGCRLSNAQVSDSCVVGFRMVSIIFPIARRHTPQSMVRNGCVMNGHWFGFR